jgi:hypothetical protein
MRRTGTHERRKLGGSALLPPGPALASASSGTLSLASASFGPYPASTQFYRVTGADIANLGTNAGLGSTIDVCFEQRGMADESFFTYCDATSGYFINHNSSGDTRIFLRSGAPTNHTITSSIFKTLNRIVITRLPGGALRCSKNGDAAFQLNAAPSYVDASVTAECIFGRSMSGVGTSGCTTLRHVQILYYRQAMSDADMQTISGTVNDYVNRYKAGDTALARLASYGGWHVDALRDFTAGASLTAGAGTTPPTWTLNGASVAKNTINAKRLYSFAPSQTTDGGQVTVTTMQASSATYNRGQPFQRNIFVSDCTEAAFMAVHDWSGVTNMIDFAVDSGGVAQSNSNVVGGGIDGGEFSFTRIEDVYGLAASSKTIVATDGPDSISGGILTPTIRGQTVMGVLIDASNTFAMTLPVAPTNRALFWGDSIMVGQTPTTSSCYQAAAMLVRADYPGNVTVDGTGSYAYWHICGDAGKISATVARWTALTNATGSNRWWLGGGTNDYAFWSSFWGDATNRPNFRTQVLALLNAAHAAMPSAVFHIQSPLPRLNETNLSPPTTGIAMGDLRTDLQTVVSTIGASWCVYHDGSAALTPPPSTDYGGDGIHLVPAGMTNWKAFIKAQLAASADSVGSGY